MGSPAEHQAIIQNNFFHSTSLIMQWSFDSNVNDSRPIRALVQGKWAMRRAADSCTSGVHPCCRYMLPDGVWAVNAQPGNRSRVVQT